MQKKLFEPHYSRSFKRKVIEEYLATGCTKMFLLRKYDIQFKSAIQTWMRILGYRDPSASERPQKLKFGQITFTSLPKNKKQPGTDLEKKIRELERQLENEGMAC